MPVRPLKGFKALITQHCVTGSMQNIYHFNGYPISEEMLLGLGAGVGFVYWHTKDTMPFLGGRGNVGRPNEEGLERCAGRHTGVNVKVWETSSPRKAETALIKLLRDGQPVLLYVDIGFLPYVDLPESYHFGGHVVVAAGYDAATKSVLIAERDGELYPVKLEDLAKARGSKFKPFPPNHRWLTFDFSEAHLPYPQDVRESIQQVIEQMLYPPLANLGVKGIATAAERVPKWIKTFSTEELREICFNTALMMSARGGTGGGLFRYMYGRFLIEAGKLIGDERLAEIGEGFHNLGDLWEDVAALFEQAAKAHDLRPLLRDAAVLLTMLAEMETATWEHVNTMLMATAAV